MTAYLRRWRVAVSTTLLSSTIAVAQGMESPQAIDADTFLAMDREVIEAFLAGDADTYGLAMSNDFFLFQKGYRASRDYAVAMVSEIDCDVSDPLRLTAPHLLAVGEDAYVLSYRMDIGATCASGDITITLPTAVRAATLWVKKENSWEIGYHGENAIAKPDVAAENSGAREQASPADTQDVMDAGTIRTTPVGSLLDALMAVESAVWETWRAHDADSLVELTADDIAFVNVYGDFFADKKATIDNWTGPFCKVERISLSQGTATQFLPTVAVLTLTGIVDGVCGNQELSGLPVYATSVYVRQAGGVLQAGEWKWAFGLNAP